jgi:L-fuconate dehydratase
MSKLIEMVTTDVRFPTSRELAGSDAVNTDPDYSAAYLELMTDAGDGHRGCGFVFTTGRGNDVQLAAIDALRHHIVGRDVEELLQHLGAFGIELSSDSQLRWLGPEKGVIHMACGAVINALWDLKAKRAGKPLWLLLSELTTEQILDLVDFQYISDALSRNEAFALLENQVRTRTERIATLRAHGYPAYTTSPGWLGYDDEKVGRLSIEAVLEGFSMIKLKVGRDVAEDRHRLALVRNLLGPTFPIAVDANQRWGVDEAVSWMNQLAEFSPAWIEEPTSPDDILGHAAIRERISPIPVATGEHAHNRIMFKQLLQASAVDVVQIDACRVGGVNEILAILLLAAKFGVRVCPHAGGVGLCELVQHFAMFDYVALTGDMSGRAIEYVDHLHEHFAIPVHIRNGRYVAPHEPGSGAQMLPASITDYSFPQGDAWTLSGSGAYSQ